MPLSGIRANSCSSEASAKQQQERSWAARPLFPSKGGGGSSGAVLLYQHLVLVLRVRQQGQVSRDSKMLDSGLLEASPKSGLQYRTPQDTTCCILRGPWSVVTTEGSWATNHPEKAGPPSLTRSHAERERVAFDPGEGDLQNDPPASQERVQKGDRHAGWGAARRDTFLRRANLAPRRWGGGDRASQGLLLGRNPRTPQRAVPGIESQASPLCPAPSGPSKETVGAVRG